jgi:membrane-associated phospholipid phosphatase
MECVNLLYFSGLTLLALWKIHVRNSRMKAILIGVSGLAVSTVMMTNTRALTQYTDSWLRDWVPIPLMLMAYWQSGCFFDKPNLKLQSMFESWDRRLFTRLASIVPGTRAAKGIASLSETAYLLCYPVVPLGVVALHLAGRADRVGIYWLTVLLTAYPCYALLPFVPLLPPRSLHRTDANPEPEGIVRRFNLWITRHLSHNANTFPSGHVAASAAITLVLLREAPAAGIVFLFIALGISLGCVAGRYHYSADVIAALALAVAVILVIG